jgi:DNA-binding MarR family transcriptional regulator
LGKGLYNRLQGELEAREQSLGLQMSDLLALPEPECGLLNWMVRQGQVTLADVAAWLGKDQAQVRQILDGLLQKGYIREIEMRAAKTYRVRLAPKRGRELPSNLWQALDDMVGDEEEKGR